ncbi:hypothetical protein EZJ43_10505 [Pedobacter changchengzhani]|uniref:Outer membrane protein beta-barrel domain-containing protein n=1 Tax=Pedobacter changchengzhani TaxID=2529274 RepID=A0A4R5MKK9_9SPHI|nr:outer membrane beta-barrel protein [Pedobacter changchengzhani]TDG36102.1 hypothetical protein EZJ43_10505 [Pedobacter changchengzhani]
MKTITKIMASVATTVLLFAATNSNAQTTTPMMESGMGFKIGVGASIGTFQKPSQLDYGYGADLKLQWDLTPYVAVTASGGYTKLMAKTGFTDVSFIPVLGGVRVFPIGRMYIAPQIGAGFAIKDGSKTNLIYAGGVGYEWKNGIDLGVRYEGYTNNSSSPTYFKKTGQFAVRLGYNFKL